VTIKELLEERAYVERSLADLDRERAAGDLDEGQYATLRARYAARAAEIEVELASAGSVGSGGLGGSAGSGGSGGSGGSAAPAAAGESASSGMSGAAPAKRSRLASRRARLITGWGALACLVVGALLLGLAIGKVGPFAPGPSLPTLTTQQRIQIELAEAAVLEGKGEVTQPLAVYDRVLTLDPKQPVALANGGWLARLAGISQHSPVLVRNGDAEIDAAVRVAPGYPEARAYEAVVLLDDRKEPKAAAAQFRQMLDDHPSATLVWSSRPYAVRAFAAAHEPLPGGIANARRPSG
jgi:hypothetical protein